MNSVSQEVEADIRDLAANLIQIKAEAADLNEYNSASGAGTAVTALASNSTPATTESGGGLSKNQFLGGLYLIGQLNFFFSNQTVDKADFLGLAENLIGGSFPASSPVSNDVEAIGARLKALGLLVIAQYKKAVAINDIWSASELASAAGAMSGTSIVFGCSTTKSSFDAGIGLVQQLINMMTNVQATAGFWGNTASKWSHGI